MVRNLDCCHKQGEYMPQGSRRIAVVPFLILLTLSAVPIQADPTTFAPGDVFVGAENILQWFHPDGTLNRTLSSGDGTEIAELAFGADGSLYVSYWRTETPAGGIDLGKFDSMGNFIGPLGTVVCPLTSGSIHLSPLGIAPTADGNFYFSCPAFIPSESRLIKVDLQGNILQTLDFPDGVGLISLTLDSCTLFNAV